MELKNFGAVLTFAAELEERDREFYLAALKNPASGPLKADLEQIASVLAKNQKNLLRVRQENVTEMILEPIQGLRSEDFEAKRDQAEGLGLEELKQAGRNIETAAAGFYNVAAEKIEALKEVSRALKQVGKKRTANMKALA